MFISFQLNVLTLLLLVIFCLHTTQWLKLCELLSGIFLVYTPLCWGGTNFAL